MITRRVITLVLIFVNHHITDAQRLNQQKVDFSGVEAFWKVAEQITNGTITETDWNYLFSTGYYKFYENWGQRNNIKRMMVIALSPKMKSSRDSLIKIPDFNSFILQQIISTNANKISLEKFQKKLEKSDLQKAIKARAKEFLPDNLSSESYEPFIYFGVFQPDANASMTGIAIDLKLSHELADPIGLIAHEYHHFLTMNLRKKFKDIKNDSTSALMKSISQLQLEGIADMIDKDKFLNSDGRGFPSVLSKNFKKFHADPLPALKQMDSLIVAIAKEPSSAKSNCETILNSLPLGGHPHGFYMAKTIVMAFGKEALISTVSNPFDFIRAYNNAFRKLNDSVIFSEESMNFLSLLESTHTF